ncbi:GAP family protein [Mycobacterium angelicum]|uniref:GAP family protein n=1 Tax=Mycobacterium angelicum TaxID=470074 RepID=UPI0009F1708A|nr:GAP family protein [Mycobacterium angelicum]MCV7200292.1 GAP family protein [Mycobacterium angelicum]
MWGTVLVLALVATADPVRIGTSVLLSSRPRAAGLLVAFWLGGVAMSVALAAGVLFGLRDFALAVMHRIEVVTASSTAGRIQIAMGVLALLIAAAAVGQRARVGIPAATTAHLGAPPIITRLSTRAQDALRAKPLRVAFILGFGMLADFRYLAALAAILASGAAVHTQISAVSVYTLVALAFIELPLVSQLAAPTWTGQAMSAVHGVVKTHRQQAFAVVIAVLGVFLMTRGMGRV